MQTGDDAGSRLHAVEMAELSMQADADADQAATGGLPRREVPFLAEGDTPPGGWVPDPQRPAMTIWKGRLDWRTRHGPVVCDWCTGRQNSASDVLMPGGGRGRAENLDMLTGQGWRRCMPDGSFVWGTVEFSAEDAVFVDHAVQPRRPPQAHAEGAEAGMDEDMASSTTLVSAVADLDFAYALYAAMCNVDWRKEGSCGRWSVSWRGAGRVVAEMRGRGEAYIDFYCNGHEGTVREDVAAALAAIGWRPLTQAEAAHDHEAVLAEIARLETMPPSEPADWYRVRSGEGVSLSEEPVIASDRMHALAATGRIQSEERWRDMWDRIDLDREESVQNERAFEGLGIKVAD